MVVGIKRRFLQRLFNDWRKEILWKFLEIDFGVLNQRPDEEGLVYYWSLQHSRNFDRLKHHFLFLAIFFDFIHLVRERVVEPRHPLIRIAFVIIVQNEFINPLLN